MSTTQFELIDNLLNRIIFLNGLQSKMIESAKALLDEIQMKKFHEFLMLTLREGVTIEYLAECYVSFLKMTLKEMLYFKRNKRYRFSKYADVADFVYNSDTYMSKYMHGLAISNFIWPNHLLLRDFFYKGLPKDQTGSYLEIGPGHGFYFYDAVLNTDYSVFTAVDVSATSLSLTRELVNSINYPRSINLEYLHNDFIEYDTEKFYDAIVMGEVLEHVENPFVFLKKIWQVAHDSTFVFISTCVNAPEVDHIYLFSSDQEVTDMIKNASFKIVDKIVLPYWETSYSQSLEELLPINVGYILQKI